MEWDTDLNRAVDEKGIGQRFWTSVLFSSPLLCPSWCFLPRSLPAPGVITSPSWLWELPRWLQEKGVRPWGYPLPLALAEAGTVGCAATKAALSLLLGIVQAVLLEDLTWLLVKEKWKASGQRASEMVTRVGVA